VCYKGENFGRDKVWCYWEHIESVIGNNWEPVGNIISYFGKVHSVSIYFALWPIKEDHNHHKQTNQPTNQPTPQKKPLKMHPHNY
jgi:hypothetical protein